MNAKLYTRKGCHLCNHAYNVLLEHGFTVECLDIDTNETWLKDYQFCIPVVEIDGKVRFRGRVNPVLLKRFIK